MKFGSSSSGCKPRPAKGEPAQPVASLAPFAVTWPAMRRHASVWAVGKAATKTMLCRGRLRFVGKRRMTGRNESAHKERGQCQAYDPQLHSRPVR